MTWYLALATVATGLGASMSFLLPTPASASMPADALPSFLWLSVTPETLPGREGTCEVTATLRTPLFGLADVTLTLEAASGFPPVVVEGGPTRNLASPQGTEPVEIRFRFRAEPGTVADVTATVPYPADALRAFVDKDTPDAHLREIKHDAIAAFERAGAYTLTREISIGK